MEEPLTVEQLYTKYRQFIVTILYRQCGNLGDAEDMAQDTFVQAVKYLDKFRGESKIKSWLYRIAMNTYKMRLRKLSSKVEAQMPDDLPEALLSATEGSMSAIEAGIAIREAMESLSPGYRQAITLHDLQGYLHEEIGQRMGLSPGTSKSQLHKARLKMRAKLAA